MAATTGYIPVYTTVGTKTLTSLARTPFSINVVSDDLMHDQAVRSVTDSVAYTSGMMGGYRGNNSLIEISIRGIGNKSDGSTIPTYLNGSRYQTAFEIDPFFLESINVIKGPNSILYGQANPGGVMDIITKKPAVTHIAICNLWETINDTKSGWILKKISPIPYPLV